MSKTLVTVRSLTLAGALAAAGASAALANGIAVPNGTVTPGSPCATTTNPNSARFTGSCGALVTLTGGDATAAFVQDNSPAAETTYNVRFYVNSRGLTLGGAGFDLFAAYDGADPTPPATAGNAVLRVALQPNGASRQLAIYVRNNGAETSPIVVPIYKGWRSVELQWNRPAGTLNVWVDGWQCDGVDHRWDGPPATCNGLTGLVNDSETINYVRWGAVSGDIGTSSGTFKLDDFSSQRTGAIGTANPFSDVTRSDAAGQQWPMIMAMYGAGVIPECGLGTFCPNDPITRGEMADFILKARWGTDFVPAGGCPCGTTGHGACFGDVTCGVTPYADQIYETEHEGITTGCGNGNYCPSGTITRSQMAVYLIQARGNAFGPADCSTGNPFTDVPTASPFCGFIKQIKNIGITGGCTLTTFCPEDLVLRGQMSVFLHQDTVSVNHEVGSHLAKP